MSKFYTNVCRLGNNICVREQTETGANKFQVRYEPTMYIRVDEPTGITTLYGDHAKAVKLESMSAAKEFLSQYEGVSGIDIFGQQNYILQYLNEVYPGTIKYDPLKISTWSLDIETKLPTDSAYNPSHKIKIRKKT